MDVKKYIVIVWGCLLPCLAWGQMSLPEGRFTRPTAKVGQPVYFSLSYTHAPEDRVLFPDSGYADFGHFEWVGRQFFPTRTQNGLSTDSVVYTLRTFELDTVQQLSLPVFLMRSKTDTQKVYSRPDELTLNYALRSLDTLQQAAQQGAVRFLKSDTRFQKVSREFNYPYFIIGAVLVLLLVVLIIVLFGKRIQKFFRQRRMKKKYRLFLESYKELQAKEPDSQTAEALLTLWKRYLEGLHKAPYSSYTGREIARLHPEAGLQEPLRSVDRAVYGGKVTPEIHRSFAELQQYATRAYEQQLNDLKND